MIVPGAIAAAVVSFLMTRVLVNRAERFAIWDIPNERSSHAAPKPRTGGIALFAAWCVGFILSGAARMPGDGAIFLAVGGFFLLGLCDDRSRLSVRTRLAVQLALAAGLVAAGLRLCPIAVPGLGVVKFPSAISAALTVFWICGFVNLFNFMDGIDGLAAGHAAIFGLFLGILGHEPLVFIAAAAALGFLMFNAPPAKIFMGDSGSYLLGSLLAVFAVRGCAHAPFPVFILIFGLFIADTFVTLLRRMGTGESWYNAHRSHYYQRLGDRGWSHRRVACLYVFLSLGLGTTAVVYSSLSVFGQILIFAAAGGVIGALFFWIARKPRSS